MSEPLSREQEWVLLELAGELGETERAKLAVALTKDPELRRFREEAALDDQVTASLLIAAGEGERVPPMPASIRAELEAQRKQLSRRKNSEEPIPFPEATPQSKSSRMTSWLMAMAAIIVGLVVVIGPELRRGGGNQATTVATIGPAWAPRGLTAVTEPVVVWDNVPNQAYDVWILPAEGTVTDAPALFVKKGVRSPVAFDQLEPAAPGDTLQPGTEYRVLVCLADQGRLAGEAVPFTIMDQAAARVPQPATADDALTIVRRLAAVGRPGDALMVIEQLPPNERADSRIESERQILKNALEPQP